MYVTIAISVDLIGVVYFKHFLMYPLSMFLLASHSLVYGLYKNSMVEIGFNPEKIEES